MIYDLMNQQHKLNTFQPTENELVSIDLIRTMLDEANKHHFAFLGNPNGTQSYLLNQLEDTLKYMFNREDETITIDLDDKITSQSLLEKILSEINNAADATQNFSYLIVKSENVKPLQNKRIIELLALNMRILRKFNIKVIFLLSASLSDVEQTELWKYFV